MGILTVLHSMMDFQHSAWTLMFWKQQSTSMWMKTKQGGYVDDTFRFRWWEIKFCWIGTASVFSFNDTVGQTKIAKKYTLGQTRSPKKYTLEGGTSSGTFTMKEPPPPWDRAKFILLHAGAKRNGATTFFEPSKNGVNTFYWSNMYGAITFFMNSRWYLKKEIFHFWTKWQIIQDEKFLKLCV